MKLTNMVLKLQKTKLYLKSVKKEGSVPIKKTVKDYKPVVKEVQANTTTSKPIVIYNCYSKNFSSNKIF